MPSHKVRVRMSDGKYAMARLVRPRRPNEPRYTNVKKVPVLAKAISRAMGASQNMQKNLALELLHDRITKKEYEKIRLAIERKTIESVGRKTQQIKRIDERDPKLTMLYKALFFKERVQDYVKNKHACLITFDVDHFRRINRKLGHEGGDEVLQFIGRKLNQLAWGRKGFAGRLGGEEFGVLSPGGKDRALEFVKQLNEEMVKEFQGSPELRLEFKGVLPTISVGIVDSHEAQTMRVLLKTADVRLYESKRAGRNRVTYGKGPSSTRVIR